MRNSYRAAVAAATIAFSGSALADGSLLFLIDGDTFTQDYSLTNNSTAGESVLAFGFDISGTGLLFDPVDSGPPGNGTLGTPFTATGGTDAITGLVGAPAIADGATFFEVIFNSFGTGETFSFQIDIDPADPLASPTVLGNNLIGSTVYADFSNGLRGSGQLVAVDGNPDASQFVITTFTPTPGAIPEPGTWAMLLTGFAGAGAALRRGKRSRSAKLQVA